jgi:hypothetical protein
LNHWVIEPWKRLGIGPVKHEALKKWLNGSIEICFPAHVSALHGSLVTTNPLPRSMGEPSMAQTAEAPGICRCSARPVT